MQLEIEVVLWRGGIAESRHRIQAAIVDADGRVHAGSPDVSRVTTFRSAAKPFQLLPLVERGHADRWGFRDEELAVMAASHNGSEAHVALVTGILDRIGRTERDLACGFHEPQDAESLARVRAHPDERSSLYNNCSGKHAGMLALALAEGWPIEGYERPEHPVQRLMRDTVAAVCGVDAEKMPIAIDGCSVIVFGLPLTAMARGYARLASARSDGDPRSRALARIRDAMSTWPRATSGAGRFAAVWMEAAAGRVVAKGGAEGLECAALVPRGLGLALKCEDGNARAVAPAVVTLLESLDWLDDAERAALASFREPAIDNHAGRHVGSLKADVRIGTAALA